jgi:endonuclease/exonuclease/phosphatase family metal-dependent hydrolase
MGFRRSSIVVPVAALMLVLAACSSEGGGSDSDGSSPASQRIKVMTFNIEYGGKNVSYDNVIAAISQADPDVVGVNEPGKNIPDIAEQLGWKYFDAERQLIAKFPIKPPADDNPRYSYVEVSPGHFVAISDVHLASAPAGPNIIARKDADLAEVMAVEKKNRLPEATLVADNLKWNAEQGVPSFMVGDFNTPSHLDWTQEMVGTRPQIKFAVEWPVTKMLEDKGFVDSYRAIHPDPATDPGLTWPAARPKIEGEWNPGPTTLADRIDMIFSAGPAKATASTLVGEEGAPGVTLSETPWPSDHRAVLSTFDVTPTQIPDPRPFVTATPELVTAGDPLTVTFFASGADAEVAVVPAGAKDTTNAVVEEPISSGEPVAGFEPARGVTFDTKGWKAEAHDVVVVLNGEVLARQSIWVKNPGDKPTVATAKSVYSPGEGITATWYAAPANRLDWVGLYKRGADPQKDYYILWVYTGGTVAGEYTFGRADAGPWPLAPGDYTVYYLLNDGYRQIAGGDFTIK